MFRTNLFRTLQISTPSNNGVTFSKSRAYLCYFLTASFSSSSTSSSSSEDEETEKAHSFTVSYLVNSCGLSPKSAIVASKRVQFQNPKKPDSVIAFLRGHEFSETQISRFVARRPTTLLADPEKTFRPKLEFFHSKGISKKNMASFFSSNPGFLYRSLKNNFIPTFDFLKRFSLTDEQAVSAILNQRWHEPLHNHLARAESNVRLFRDLGFSNSNIGSLLIYFSDILVMEPERLIEIVNKVRDMGFVPEKYMFRFALRMLSHKHFEAKWRTSYEAYTRWGWSKDDILHAFRYHPNCMLMSDKKIGKTMGFLVNEMGFLSKKIAERPVVLFYSFEKRIFPRCSVVRVLWSKGLVERSDVSLASVLQCVEKRFVENYVTKYLGNVPLLLSVYRGNVDAKDA